MVENNLICVTKSYEPSHVKSHMNQVWDLNHR